MVRGCTKRAYLLSQQFPHNHNGHQPASIFFVTPVQVKLGDLSPRLYIDVKIIYVRKEISRISSSHECSSCSTPPIQAGELPNNYGCQANINISHANSGWSGFILTYLRNPRNYMEGAGIIIWLRLQRR